MVYKEWTVSEVASLRIWHADPAISLDDIAGRLDRSVKSVQAKALGLKLGPSAHYSANTPIKQQLADRLKAGSKRRFASGESTLPPLPSLQG